MTDVEALTAGRERIADKAHWLESDWHTYSGGVHRWCAVGALGAHPRRSIVAWLQSAAAELYGTLADVLPDALLGCHPYLFQRNAPANPFVVNDYLGHEAALAMYDYAIKLAKADADDEALSE